ncbi:hypothetical protein [Pseudomonas sp. F01002]|uniref:hypothetical protein n=1 Tax=Pseudomonas sp. F01002 TaxID=2555724 RepID=UPI00106DCDF2|nr:hypothetical protein [Pseudomonas sp. F01002]TFB37829.1 hypothetical protein E3W21_19220 [Pseudomonas sp. F01002]
MRYRAIIFASIFGLWSQSAAAQTKLGASVYLLCEGEIWTHQDGFGRSKGARGQLTIQIDPQSRALTVTTPLTGKITGDLAVTNEWYSSFPYIVSTKELFGRKVVRLHVSLNRFSANGVLMYELDDGQQFAAFIGDCKPATAKF